MAARVVFEGVAGEGGDLFQGIKFYLMHRLPARDRWLAMVKDNGGEIVKLEKQADIVIADHAKRDSPPGSISWRFIEQSAKQGRVLDKDDFPAGPTNRSIREVGSAQFGRKGKIPFSAEDDRILMEWCTKAELNGKHVKGNEIYKQLEEINNRHTFQSWRDRWVKYLSHRPRPVINDKIEDELEDETIIPSDAELKNPVTDRTIVRSAAVPPNRQPKQTTTEPTVETQLVQKKSTQRSTPLSSKTAGNYYFTEEDTDLLWESYDEIMNLAEDKVIDAWLAWAELNPTHTAQEWSNYFKEYIIPKKMAEDTSKRVSPRPKALAEQSTEVEVTSEARQSKEVPEIKDSQSPTSEPTQLQGVEKTAKDPATTDESLFKEDLLALAHELSLDVNFSPEICGRVIPLFKLWQVIQSDDFGGLDNVDGRKLWPKVARTLNFNDFRDPTAAQELKDCYHEILADFDEARAEYEEEPGLTESQEQAMLDAQLLGSVQPETGNTEDRYESLPDEEDHDDDLDYPQSSPQLPAPSSSMKRTSGQNYIDEHISSNKRQRIEKGKGKEKEIPSTPEDVINRNRMAHSFHKPASIRGFSTSRDSNLDESDEKEGLFVGTPSFQERKLTLTSSHPAAEPETQDFHFLPEMEEHENPFVDRPRFQPSHSLPEENISGNGVATDDGSGGDLSSEYESSTQSQTESQTRMELESFINYSVSLGYTEDVVIEALHATTWVTGPDAYRVMECLSHGEDIPPDIEGVWTTIDDDALEDINSEEYRAVRKKHGSKRCSERKRYKTEMQDSS